MTSTTCSRRRRGGRAAGQRGSLLASSRQTSWREWKPTTALSGCSRKPWISCSSGSGSSRWRGRFGGRALYDSGDPIDLIAGAQADIQTRRADYCTGGAQEAFSNVWSMLACSTGCGWSQVGWILNDTFGTKKFFLQNRRDTLDNPYTEY